MIRASDEGHLPVVQWLVQSGADIEAKDIVNILYIRTVHRPVFYPSLIFTSHLGRMYSSDTCK